MFLLLSERAWKLCQSIDSTVLEFFRGEFDWNTQQKLHGSMKWTLLSLEMIKLSSSIRFTSKKEFFAGD